MCVCLHACDCMCMSNYHLIWPDFFSTYVWPLERGHKWPKKTVDPTTDKNKNLCVCACVLFSHNSLCELHANRQKIIKKIVSLSSTLYLYELWRVLLWALHSDLPVQRRHWRVKKNVPVVLIKLYTFKARHQHKIQMLQLICVQWQIHMCVKPVVIAFWA